MLPQWWVVFGLVTAKLNYCWALCLSCAHAVQKCPQPRSSKCACLMLSIYALTPTCNIRMMSYPGDCWRHSVDGQVHIAALSDSRQQTNRLISGKCKVEYCILSIVEKGLSVLVSPYPKWYWASLVCMKVVSRGESSRVVGHTPASCSLPPRIVQPQHIISWTSCLEQGVVPWPKQPRLH